MRNLQKGMVRTGHPFLQSLALMRVYLIAAASASWTTCRRVPYPLQFVISVSKWFSEFKLYFHFNIILTNCFVFNRPLKSAPGDSLFVIWKAHLNFLPGLRIPIPLVIVIKDYFLAVNSLFFTF